MGRPCGGAVHQRPRAFRRHRLPLLSPTAGSRGLRVRLARPGSARRRDGARDHGGPRRRRAILVEYDGTDFVGWQVQANGRSVQGVLERAVRELFHETERVVGSGRTDAGVHARGQVAHLDLRHEISPQRLLAALNSRLPPDVRVIAAADVPCDFHARRDAILRRYRYTLSDGPVPPVIDRRTVAHVPTRLDQAAMAEAARYWLGRHDFSSFRGGLCAAESPIRTLNEITVERDARGYLVFEVSARAFLQHQVRTMVGTLVEIGRGARPIEWARDVLEARDRAAAGPNAPPCGLVLQEVRYEPPLFDVGAGM